MVDDDSSCGIHPILFRRRLSPQKSLLRGADFSTPLDPETAVDVEFACPDGWFELQRFVIEAQRQIPICLHPLRTRLKEEQRARKQMRVDFLRKPP